MATQLNIKDPETIRLARTLADASGQSITAVIRSALERAATDRDEDVRKRMAAFNAVVADLQARMPPEWTSRTSKDMMDEMYDEDGLPI